MTDTTDAKTLTKKAPSGKRKKITTPAPAKKAPAKKAAAKKATPADGTTTRAVNGPSGWLQDEILSVCADYADGKVDTDGKPLTPHRIAKIIGTRGNPEPSSGAVAACLDRWVEYGFATVNPKPKSFKAITAAGKRDGLEALVAKHRAKLSAAKKAAKGS